MTFHHDGSLQAPRRTLLYAGRAVDLVADVGQMTGLSGTPGQAANIMRPPALLLCYWMGAAELDRTEPQD
jgi:hypothetical protein